MHISYQMLPPNARDSLQSYVDRGVPTGSFLEQILCNDFVGAAARADDFNKHLLFHYAQWLYCEAPSACWGDSEIVAKWIKHRGMEGFSENKDG